MITDPDDTTLATYEATADSYIEQTTAQAPVLLAFLDRLADLVGHGHVLELGSGPGWDADYLEARGVQVTRTDATRAFVDRLRAAGHQARLLDIRRDDLGGPYDAVLADAVLLHLNRDQFRHALCRIQQAITSAGLLAITLKEGDGEGWSTAKLGLPRHFTYWREPALRQALDDAGWCVTFLAHVPGRTDQWLHVIAQPINRAIGAAAARAVAVLRGQ